MDDRDRDAGRSVRFVGNLDDPWVASIAEALPATTERVRCPSDMPEELTDPETAPGVLVLHRAVLSRHDAEGLRRLRSGPTPPRVVLCHGPHVRYADLDRWADLFDATVPEATAREVIARRVFPPGDGVERRAAAGSRPRVAVVSANAALRLTLAEACEAAGYPVSAARDWHEAPAAGPAVWDVPVLELDRPQAQPPRGRADPVIALIGFADRAVVTEARARGAAACMELPVDLADLVAVLDRLTAARGEAAHELPPSPAGRRRPATAGAVADKGRGA